MRYGITRALVVSSFSASLVALGQGMSPLGKAIMAQDPIQVEAILNENPELVNDPVVAKSMPLTMAAYRLYRSKEDAKICDILLRYGADPLRVTDAGLTALHTVIFGFGANQTEANLSGQSARVRSGIRRMFNALAHDSVKQAHLFSAKNNKGLSALQEASAKDLNDILTDIALCMDPATLSSQLPTVSEIEREIEKKHQKIGIIHYLVGNCVVQNFLSELEKLALPLD